MDAYADNPMRCPSPAASPATTEAPSSPRSSSERETRITEDLIACRAFSSKPAGGDLDYPAEGMAYVNIWLGLGHRPPRDGHHVPRGPGRPRTGGGLLPGLRLEPSRHQPAA